MGYRLKRLLAYATHIERFYVPFPARPGSELFFPPWVLPEQPVLGFFTDDHCFIAGADSDKEMAAHVRPHGRWDRRKLDGKIDEIKVRVNTVPVNQDLVGDYASDRAFRRRFQRWLNRLREEKERCIEGMLNC